MVRLFQRVDIGFYARCAVFRQRLLFGALRRVRPSQHGQLSGNHFLTIIEGLDDLYDFGRKVLYDGAQDIEITLLEDERFEIRRKRL